MKMKKFKGLNECTIDELYQKRKVNKTMFITGVIFGTIYTVFGLFLYLLSGWIVFPIMFFILGSSLMVGINRNYAIDIMIYLKQQDMKKTREIVDKKQSSLKISDEEIQQLTSVNKVEEDINLQVDKKLKEKQVNTSDKMIDEMYNKIIGDLK